MVVSFKLTDGRLEGVRLQPSSEDEAIHLGEIYSRIIPELELFEDALISALSSGGYQREG